MENRPQSVTESTRGDEFNAQEVDAEEVEVLEKEIHEMAQKLSIYRSTFPDQLRSGLASVLGAERPEFPPFDWDSNPAFARDMDKDEGSHGESCEGVIAAVEDQETLNLIKEKISRNVSAMPLVVKRLNECVSRINKLNSHRLTATSYILHCIDKRKEQHSLSKP